MYIKARMKGKTDEEALAIVQDYAIKKYPGV
jgi:hypothetical protein